MLLFAYAPGMNVLLTGMRASGKSTIGPPLARELGLGFVELDDESARLLDAPDAAAAIRSHGLPAFRDAESRALRGVLARDDQVVSLGGGTPTAAGVEALIASNRAAGRVRVIFIDADAATIRARIAADGPSARPPILGRDSIEEVEEVMRARRPVYLRIADLRVEPKGGDPLVIARTLAAMVRNLSPEISGRRAT